MTERRDDLLAVGLDLTVVALFAAGFGGLAGRLLLGEGADGAFPVVAAAILAAGMLAWRLVILAISRRRSRRPAP